MEYRPLDITVISASDLKNVNMFMNMDVYVVVYIGEHEESLTTKRKTHVDRSGGCDPEWNHRFKFTVEESSIFKTFINFQLKAERSIGDKVVGEVRIYLADFFRDCIDNKTSKDIEAEYQVMTMAGKAKGSLKISFRFGEKFIQQVDRIGHATSAAPPSHEIYPPPSSHVDIYPPPPTEAVAGSGVHYLPPPHVDIYPPPPTAGDNEVAGGGVHYPPPYGMHSQPVMVAGQYPVPPQYNYQLYSGGYVYPYPPPYYPPPPGVPGYGYTGHPVAYPYVPIQQPNHVQERSAEKEKSAGLGSKLGMGLGAGLLGGFLVGDMASEAGEMASKNVVVAAGGADIEAGDKADNM